MATTITIKKETTQMMTKNNDQGTYRLAHLKGGCSSDPASPSPSSSPGLRGSTLYQFQHQHQPKNTWQEQPRAEARRWPVYQLVDNDAPTRAEWTPEPTPTPNPNLLDIQCIHGANLSKTECCARVRSAHKGETLIALAWVNVLILYT